MSDTTAPLRAALEERRKRALREILTEKDDAEERYGVAPADADRLRRVIVDQVNDLARLADHLITSVGSQLDQTAGVNRLYLERLADLLELGDVTLATDETPAPALRRG